MKRPLILSVFVALTWSGVAAAADPTRPPTGGSSSSASERVPRGPALQGTRVAGSYKTAVINGRTVSVGDTVDGAVVAEIRPYEVILRRNGQDTTLRMLPRLEKRIKAKE